MKRSILFILALFLTYNIGFGQQQNYLEDSATQAYGRKDFISAFKYYEAYFGAKGSQNNYNTFYAAIAACHSGNIERAKYYLIRSGKIGFDTTAYEAFAEDSLNSCLHKLPEWEHYITTFKHKTDSTRASIAQIMESLSDNSGRINSSLLTDTEYWQRYKENHNARQLIQHIKTYKDFQAPVHSGFWTLYNFRVSDSLTVPFLLYIPKTYNPSKQTPLYVYLHGGVINRPEFPNPAYIPGGLEIKVMDRAIEQGAFILYPFGKKDFGWLYQQEAFEAILGEIALVKSLYNIDDNKVYVGGHSNGGTGAYWFAVSKPSAFAAFFGLNYLPKQYVGNTALRNMTNGQTFYGVNGLQDDLFPYQIVSSIYEYAKGHDANWNNYPIAGGHTATLEKRDSIAFLFDTIVTRSRTIHPRKIIWETDDVRNGRNQWLEITQLDTLAERSEWHKDLNPTVTMNGKTGKINFTVRRSGAVVGEVKDNEIQLHTSCVKTIALYISPDMFNLRKKLKIYANGRLVFNEKLRPDKSVVLDEFFSTKDRKLIYTNKLMIDI